MITQDDTYRVWRIVYDGDPLMSGGHEVRSISKEFDSREQVSVALGIVGDPRRMRHAPKPNLRVQTRLVTEWEDA